jgi:hypothetical protein
VRLFDKSNEANRKKMEETLAIGLTFLEENKKRMG